MRLKSIRIQNFKTLQDVFLDDLPDLAVFIGANGAGKSTIIEVFRFMKDCVERDLLGALSSEAGRRGGFQQLRSKGQNGAIMLEFVFSAVSIDSDRMLRYLLEINIEDKEIIIEREELYITEQILNQHLNSLKNRLDSSPIEHVSLSDNLSLSNESVIFIRTHNVPNIITFADNQQRGTYPKSSLAIKMLTIFGGPSTEYCQLIIQYFQKAAFSELKDLTNNLPTTYESEKHLDTDGLNLPQVIKYILERNKDSWGKVLGKFRHMVPEVETVEVHETPDQRLYMTLKPKHLGGSFANDQLSPGTLRMLAYLVLLNEPEPHDLLLIEEPENDIYHTNLPSLLESMRNYGYASQHQVFVTTHSPMLLSAAEPQEVYYMFKENGYTKVVRASDNPKIMEEINFGDKIGALWSRGEIPDITPR